MRRLGIGLELGPSFIRAVVVERAAQVTLLAAQDVPCETANPEALTRTLTQLRQTLPIHGPIVLGIPSASAILTTVTPLIPNPTRSHVAVQFELQQQLPFELAEAAWHYRWLTGNAHALTQRSGLRAQGSGPRGATPRPPPVRLSPQSGSAAVVAAMKRSLLEERLACCRRAGVSIRAVAVNPLATLNAWWFHPSSRDVTGVTLVNLINDEMAEWVLVTPTTLRVVPVTSPSPDAFWQELAGSWEALRAEGADPSQRVWVTGGSSVWPQLHEVLTTQCRLQVERYEVSSVVGEGAAGVGQASGKFATAIGLALQGVGVSRFPLNLVHDTQQAQQALQVQRFATLTSAVGLVASFALGLSGMLELRHRRLRLLDTLERQERLYQTLRPDVRELLQRQQQAERRIQQLERLVGQGPVLTQLVAQTAQMLPDDVWLTKLEYAKSPLVVAAKGSPMDGLEGLLEGRAKSFQALTQLTDRLKGTGETTSVKPLSTNVTTDQTSGKEIVVFAVQIQRLLGPASPPASAREEPAPPKDAKAPGKKRR